MMQKHIMKTDATMETFAAPAMPCVLTASAINGTVALAVPPISSELRPSRTTNGVERMDVKTPRMGGRPIKAAIESP